MSKKASFKNSFGLLLVSVLLFLAFRWAVLEPFVIPSGSMIPSLLINDHIVVAKWSYGLRLPFTKKWLTEPKVPARGDVVVFNSVDRDDFYMIKRVVGLPGDEVKFTEGGQLEINGQPVERRQVEPTELARRPFYPVTSRDVGRDLSTVEFYLERFNGAEHPIILEADAVRWEGQKFKVPKGQLFVLGDNRDSSRDSRYWGFVPQKNLVGKALFVWLSCTETLARMNYLCDPRHIRWQRLFYPIQ